MVAPVVFKTMSTIPEPVPMKDEEPPPRRIALECQGTKREATKQGDAGTEHTRTPDLLPTLPSQPCMRP